MSAVWQVDGHDMRTAVQTEQLHDVDGVPAITGTGLISIAAGTR